MQDEVVGARARPGAGRAAATRPLARAAAARAPTVAVSTVSGASPSRPRTTARSLPCPRPVAPSEPNSSARTRVTDSSSPSCARPSAKVRAARIGPTVCDDDGPIPIENRSKTLMATRSSCAGDRPVPMRRASRGRPHVPVSRFTTRRVARPMPRSPTVLRRAITARMRRSPCTGRHARRAVRPDQDVAAAPASRTPDAAASSAATRSGRRPPGHRRSSISDVLQHGDGAGAGWGGRQRLGERSVPGSRGKLDAASADRAPAASATSRRCRLAAWASASSTVSPGCADSPLSTLRTRRPVPPCSRTSRSSSPGVRTRVPDRVAAFRPGGRTVRAAATRRPAPVGSGRRSRRVGPDGDPPHRARTSSGAASHHGGDASDRVERRTSGAVTTARRLQRIGSGR